MGRIPDTTKNALNRKDNPLDKNGVENSAARTKQTKGTNRAEIASSLKNAKKEDKQLKDFENSSPQINEYLKMISRFENKVKQDQIDEKDLERVMQALEDKILSLNSQQKNRLKNIELFKTKGIENLKNMKESLIEMFESKEEREAFFEFLKSPEFVTLLLNEQKPLEGYSPAAKAQANQNGNSMKAGKPAGDMGPPKIT